MSMSPAQKNSSHHEDLTWVKVGRSEYMRADGVTIRKHPRIKAWWEVRLPSGEKASASVDGRETPHMSASASSLHHAKWMAESVTPDTTPAATQ